MYGSNLTKSKHCKILIAIISEKILGQALKMYNNLKPFICFKFVHYDDFRYKNGQMNMI